jgi:hypothetical protein
MIVSEDVSNHKISWMWSCHVQLVFQLGHADYEGGGLPSLTKIILSTQRIRDPFCTCYMKILEKQDCFPFSVFMFGLRFWYGEMSLQTSPFRTLKYYLELHKSACVRLRMMYMQGICAVQWRPSHCVLNMCSRSAMQQPKQLYLKIRFTHVMHRPTSQHTLALGRLLIFDCRKRRHQQQSEWKILSMFCRPPQRTQGLEHTQSKISAPGRAVEFLKLKENLPL